MPDWRLFDSFVEDYARMQAITHQPIWPILAELGVRSGERALDAGCGVGRCAAEFADHFDEVVGVDLSEPMIAYAHAHRTHPTIDYRVGDLADPDRLGEVCDPDGTGFDLVFSHTALHHVPIDRLDASLRALHRLVRPGGSAVFVDCVTERSTPIPKYYFQVGTLLSLPGTLRRHGWRDGWWLTRFNLTGAWVEHRATDILMSKAEFRRRYGTVFEGAGFGHQLGLFTMIWHRPAT